MGCSAAATAAATLPRGLAGCAAAEPAPGEGLAGLLQRAAGAGSLAGATPGIVSRLVPVPPMWWEAGLLLRAEPRAGLGRRCIVTPGALRSQQACLSKSVADWGIRHKPLATSSCPACTCAASHLLLAHPPGADGMPELVRPAGAPAAAGAAGMAEAAERAELPTLCLGLLVLLEGLPP
jgi:hypothetical protein